MSAPPSLWIHRLLWVSLPFTVGEALADQLAARSSAVRVVAAVLAWSGWGLGLVAAAVALPVSLTALRLATPIAATLAAWPAARGDLTVVEVIGLASAVLAARLACGAAVADHCVDGASYGDERRFLLRAPAAFSMGPIPVAVAVVGAAVAAGPLLLAARQWLVGVVALVLGAAAAVVAVRALHGLSRRWLVFVPAGMTIVDHLALAEPVLLPARSIVSFGPAVEGTTALDLSQQAPGLVLEAAMASPVELSRRTGATDAQLEAPTAVLLSPASPAAVLREAERRAVPPAATSSPT